MARSVFALAPHTLPCTRCKERKPIQEFGRWADGVSRGGFYSLCFGCSRARARKAWRRRRAQSQVIPETKRCPKCGETKDASEFSPNAGNVTGLSSRCKRCAASSATARYAANPEVRARVAAYEKTPARRKWKKAYSRRYNEERGPEKKREYDKRSRDIIAAELEARGGVCTRCKEPFGDGRLRLEWHHRDPKTKLFNIFSVTQGTSVERLRAELEKCDPFHSSCHKTTHWEKRNNAERDLPAAQAALAQIHSLLESAIYGGEVGGVEEAYAIADRLVAL